MKRIGSMRGDTGSVTIAAAVLLSGIILLNTALYDYAVYKALESRAAAGMLLACKSVLASYDSLLAEKYGLYGFNTGNGGSAHDLFDDYYPSEASIVALSGNFTEPDVLREQICGMMKIKTPASLTETMLYLLGVLSEAKEEGAGYRACGEAAELLSALQKTHRDLKILVEGYYDGDPACVNGYSVAAASGLFENMSQIWQEKAEAFLDQAILLHEQYREYNSRAALLCQELADGRQKIVEVLRRAESTGALPKEADVIRQQAAQIGSAAAADKISENLSVFAERLSALYAFKEQGEFDAEKFRYLFVERQISANIRIPLIYAENTSGETNGTELITELKEQLLGTANLPQISEDSYRIPEQEYAALPSTRFSPRSSSLDSFGVDAGDSLETFASFTDLFAFKTEVSFEEVLRGTAERLLIDDYILNYMTSRLYAPSEDRLNNEAEYILIGDASAAQNNKSVENRILALRFLLNFIKIMKDAERSAGAEALARAAAAALSMGAGVTLYKIIIVSAWALLDSYQDLEKLLSGQSVPILTLNEAAAGRIDALQDYAFYLRILLLLTPVETKLMRICDVIEINMKETTGMTYRLSGVYHKLSASARTRMPFLSPFLLGLGRKQYEREDVCEITY